jgi:hypothetical protein
VCVFVYLSKIVRFGQAGGGSSHHSAAQQKQKL